MADILAITFIVITVGLAVLYLIRQKKKGAKCIGCPYANECASKNEKCSCGNKK